MNAAVRAEEGMVGLSEERVSLALTLGRRRMASGRTSLDFGRVVFFEVGLLMSIYVISAVSLLAPSVWTPFAGGTLGAPRALSLVVLLAVVLGIRAGRRGAFLPIDRPALVHVLSAPVPWPALLRPLLVKPLLLGTSAGLLGGVCLGAGIGLRLGGATWRYAVDGGLAAAALVAAYRGAGLMEYAGAAVRRAFHALVVLTVLATAFDAIASTTISWATAIGSLVGGSPHPLVVAWGVLPPLVLGVAGGLLVWEIPLERVLRRTELLWSFGFGAADESPRSLWLSYRRLSGESPRPRPWFRVPREFAQFIPVPGRDLRGLVRTPTGAVARLGVLAAFGCFAMFQVEAGAPAFALGAGIAAYLIGLELLEGLAQEGDSPELADVLPASRGRLIAYHMAAPAMLLVILWTAVSAVSAASVVAAGNWQLAFAAMLAGVTGGLGAIVVAAYSLTRRPRRVIQEGLAAGTSDAFGGPGLAVLWGLLIRYGGPMLVASMAYLPVIAAQRRAGAGMVLLFAAAVLVVYAVLAVRVVVWGRTAGVVASILGARRRIH